MRIALVAGAAFLLLSGNVMHATESAITLNFVGVNAVPNPANPDPSLYLELDQLTYSSIIASGGTGYFNNIPDGFTVAAPSTLYLSGNGGPDSGHPYTLGFQAYGDSAFTVSGLDINLTLGPDEAVYDLYGDFFAGSSSFIEVPGIVVLIVTDTDGTYAVEPATLGFAPEPSSLLLAVTGLLGTAVVMRRRYTFPSR